MTTSKLAAPREQLYLRLCGRLRGSHGDEELPLDKTARQGRLTLAYLALHPDQKVTRWDILREMSPDPDLSRDGASLSQTLSRLRRILGRERLEALPGGDVWLHGPVTVDILEAEDALEDLQRAVDRRQWGASFDASRLLVSRLDEEVLAGDEAPFLEDCRRRTSEIRVEALKLQATAALRIGRWGDAIKAARRAIKEDRTLESAWELVIRAQAGRGDVALAIQTCDELRRLLMDEMGVTPSPRLIDLHRRLLKGELPSDVQPGAAPRVAFPTALTLKAGDEAFVGRRQILKWLREHYADVQRGVSRFVLLSGEPGIGKTRLAGRFAAGAHEQGATVLYGRADRETLVPYQPFVAAVGHYVSECGDFRISGELGPELSELSRLMPNLARRIPELREPLEVEPEMRRYRLFMAAANVLAFVARDAPAVLIVDDLHWADDSTALLLRYMVDEIRGAKLLIIGSLRTVADCRSEELADFLALSEINQVTLPGLGEPEIAELVDARAGLAATADAVGALKRATGGNPLLLHETLKSLAEAAPRDEVLSQVTVRDIGLPEGARHVIRRRIEGLSDSTQQVLSAASVIGAEFAVPVLVHTVADGGPNDVFAALEEAGETGLVRPMPGDHDRYEFSHALVREALVQRQSRPRLRWLHHRIAEALETITGPAAPRPAELVHHFTATGDRRYDAKVVHYSVEAGREANASLGYAEAATHFKRALNHLGPKDDRRRCETLIELGTVQSRLGLRDARESLGSAFALASRIEAATLQARAALGFASRYTEAGVVDEDEIALLRTARDLLGKDDKALLSEVTARLADRLHFVSDPDEPQRLSNEALRLARESGDAHAWAVALESRHAALMSIEHLDERLRLSQELIDLAQTEDDRELEALGRHWRIHDLLEAAEMDEARRERDALAALAETLRQPLYQHFAKGWEVVWAHMAGKLSEIEGLADQFKELGNAAHARDTRTLYRAQIIALERRRERLPEFISTVQAAVEEHPALLAWRAVLPLTRLIAGDAEAAIAEFEGFAEDGFSQIPRDMFWFTAICVLAETCALIAQARGSERDTAHARELYDLIEPFKDRNVVVMRAACWGSSRRFLGLLAATLGRMPEAISHLETAIARNEACANPAGACVVRRDLAKLLLKRRAEGDLDWAAELLREPLRAAKAIDAEDAEALVVRIEAEVQAVERERQAITP